MAEAGSSKARTSSTSQKAAAAAAQLEASQRLSSAKVGPAPGGTVQAKILEDTGVPAIPPPPAGAPPPLSPQIAQLVREELAQSQAKIAEDLSAQVRTLFSELVAPPPAPPGVPGLTRPQRPVPQLGQGFREASDPLQFAQQGYGAAQQGYAAAQQGYGAARPTTPAQQGGAYQLDPGYYGLPGYPPAPTVPQSFVDPQIPLRRSTLSFQQQLAAGTEAQRIEVIRLDPGFVPVNAYAFAQRRRQHQRVGARSTAEEESESELRAAEPLLDTPSAVNPGKGANPNRCYSARDKHELKTLRAVVHSLADIIGYVAGDPAGRIQTAFPQLKETFENASLRLSVLQTAAMAEAGYLEGADRNIVLTSSSLDATESALATAVHPQLAGRLSALNAKTAEARFNATAKAQAQAQVDAAKKAAGKP